VGRSPQSCLVVKNDPIPGHHADAVLVDQDSPRGVSWSRKILALLIAVAVDAPPVCLLGESVPFLFDAAVAAVLWLVLGRSRLLAMALLIECIPGVGLAPTWTMYVLWEIIFSKAAKTPLKPMPPVLPKSQE
jgi:hypothetical protein